MRGPRRSVALLAAAALCLGMTVPAFGSWESWSWGTHFNANFYGDGDTDDVECNYVTDAAPTWKNVTDDGPAFKLEGDDIYFERGNKCQPDWPEYLGVSGWVKSWWTFPDGNVDTWPPTSTRTIWRLTVETIDGEVFEARGRSFTSADRCDLDVTGPLILQSWPHRRVAAC